MQSTFNNLTVAFPFIVVISFADASSPSPVALYAPFPSSSAIIHCPVVTFWILNVAFITSILSLSSIPHFIMSKSPLVFLSCTFSPFT